MKAGETITAIGEVGQSLIEKMTDEANATRVDGELTLLASFADDRAFNTEDGYLTLKGANALERPNGQSLVDEYGSQFDKKASELQEGLANDAQKRMFSQKAASLSLRFREDVSHHVFKEYGSYQESVTEGQAEQAKNSALLNWHNPRRIEESINGYTDPRTGAKFGGLRDTLRAAAERKGLAPAMADAYVNDGISEIHTNVIKTALGSGDDGYAIEYYRKNKKNMRGGDILSVSAQITDREDGVVAMTAVAQASKKLQPSTQPTEMDRFLSVTQTDTPDYGKRVDGTQKGGGYFGEVKTPDGKVATELSIGVKIDGKETEIPSLVPSLTDAEVQHLVSGKKPTKAIVEKARKHAEERMANGQSIFATQEDTNRAKQMRLQQALQEFGDGEQALAAYDAGDEAVKTAIQYAEEDGKPEKWIEYLPKKTQAFVEQAGKKYEKGGSLPPMSTESQFTNAAIEALGENPRMSVVKATRDEASRQYKLIKKQRDDLENQAVEEAQKQLIDNGGDWVGLPPGIKANLKRFAVGKYDDVMKFAKVLAGDGQPTNMTEYVDAVTHPDKLARMNDADFTRYVKTNFDDTDQKTITKLRADALNPNSDDTINSVDNTSLNNTLTNRLRSIGINPKPKADKKGKVTDEEKQLAAVQKFVRDELYSRQKALGKKLVGRELEDFVDDLFSKQGEAKGRIWGTNEVPLLQMDYDDIPRDDKNAIKEMLNGYGVTNPTEDDILRTYWTWKEAHD